MQTQTQVALVTGATRGIGKAIAECLGKKGHFIAGTATTEAGVALIDEHFKTAGISGRGYLLDVCDQAAILAVHEAITQAAGAPMILVNNAAVTDDQLLLRMKPTQWQRVIDTNLTGVYSLTQACLRAMLKARFGRVVSITSVVGVTGNPGQANYCAAKAGVIGFTKALAQEMASKNITFNTVAPGFIQTDMTAALTPAQQEVILSKIPMNVMGRSEDIAAAVAFLISEDAAYITGQTLHVNGGLYMP